MNKFLFIFSLMAGAYVSHAQVNYAPLSIKTTDVEKKLAEYEKNSRVDYTLNQYKTAFFAALQYYPELKNIRIKVVPKKIDMLMKVHPTWLSSIRRPQHRKYKIFVNEMSTKTTPDPGSFTFNAQVGVFGHELAHICDYLTMRCRKLAQCGMHYKKPAHKKVFEQSTDKRTLEHGLGWQLYDFTVQWNNLPDIYTDYIAKKKQFYLDSKQMLGMMLDMGYQ